MAKTNRKSSSGWGCLGLLLLMGGCVWIMSKGAPRSPSTSAPPAKAHQPPGRTIPGVKAVDVHGNFTNRGFKLSTDIKSEAVAAANGIDPATWTCIEEGDGFKRVVFVSGIDTKTIRSIEATVYSLGLDPKPPRDLASEFFGFVASIPYDGADPQKARAWASAAAGKKDSTVIGAVEFTADANDRSATLTMRPARKSN